MSANHFFTFLAGAAAGAAAAWLLCSERGKETVENIKRRAAEGLDELQNAVEDVQAKASVAVKAAAETVKEAVEGCK